VDEVGTGDGFGGIVGHTDPGAGGQPVVDRHPRMLGEGLDVGLPGAPAISLPSSRLTSVPAFEGDPHPFPAVTAELGRKQPT
jgi:hypothetical protein